MQVFWAYFAEFHPISSCTGEPIMGSGEHLFAIFLWDGFVYIKTWKNVEISIKKRDLEQVSKVWRRTWDSNPRGCYTLLDFQSSSLAARSILQKYLVISDAQLYYHRNGVNASTFLIFSNYSEVVEKTGLGRSGFSTFCKASQASRFRFFPFYFTF